MIIRPSTLIMAVLLCAFASVGALRAASVTYPPEVVERGRYLAIAGDCAACHTRPQGGAAFAGGYAIESPLGKIYSSNITPSLTVGIGSYTEPQFAAALRQGVRADGSHLYPAMPYTAYAGLTDGDVEALFAYFRQSVAPVDIKPPDTNLPFPFNVRASMIAWNALFLHDARFKPNPDRDEPWNRGAYLVTVLGHCTSCHSPRGVLMGEDTSRAFAGGPVGPWYAPNITSDKVSGIGGWSHQDIVQYLKTGAVMGKGEAAGGMAEAVTNSLQYLLPGDLDAIAQYLQTIPPLNNVKDTQPAFSYGKPAVFEASLRGVAIDQGPDGKALAAAALFSGHCASCHQPTGAGTGDHVFPALFHNSATGASQADNLVAAILYGVDRDVGGRHVFMPGFGSLSYVQPLTDGQIASISNYVLQTFGNPSIEVTAADVEIARKGGVRSPLTMLADIGISVIGIAIVVLLGTLIRQIYRRRGVPLGPVTSRI
jgi:mono/diheme cytochrome c family protein